MSEIKIGEDSYTQSKNGNQTIYKSNQKINGYDITITCLNLPNGDQKAFNSIKKFFEKEIF